eukprot:Pompholyxophrys_punicea_v1_NODE_181_length_2980_cov_4.384957.p2 type:complete len:107 gc:universal NODE_181_length_2980_cov_4.384957:1637-1957(+)
MIFSNFIFMLFMCVKVSPQSFIWVKSVVVDVIVFLVANFALSYVIRGIFKILQVINETLRCITQQFPPLFSTRKNKIVNLRTIEQTCWLPSPNYFCKFIKFLRRQF